MFFLVQYREEGSNGGEDTLRDDFMRDRSKNLVFLIGTFTVFEIVALDNVSHPCAFACAFPVLGCRLDGVYGWLLDLSFGRGEVGRYGSLGELCSSRGKMSGALSVRA